MISVHLGEMIFETPRGRRPTVAEVLERAAYRAEHANVSAVDAVHQARNERDDQLQDRIGP